MTAITTTVEVPVVNFDSLPRGDTWTFDLAATRSALAIDLTGSTIWFTAKRSKNDTDANAVFQKKTGGLGIVVTNAGGGLFTVTVDPADTASLTAGQRLYYDAQVKEQSGVVTTVVEGEILVSLDVSRSTT